MVEEAMKLELVIESDIIRSYRRLSYSPWHALAEFVDNSTQSYFNNRPALDAVMKEADEKLYVRIVYERGDDIIRISDNAMGMSLSELRYALKIGRPPSDTTGRSEFGMGMKTAACWLGDIWTITTKKLGETVEHQVTIDVERVASGNLDLQLRTVQGKPAGRHYTIVEIKSLHMKLRGRRLGKVKQFLQSMYRVDLRENILDLSWNGTKLEWEGETNFLRARDGTPYYKQFNLEVDGKPVTGWVGILGKGRSGRQNAGFSILRRGRVIQGHPQAWRPTEIFGWEGRNDLLNQRLVGEVHLDDFLVSHTKDSILWRGSQEDDVGKALKQEAQDYIKVAREHRRKDEDDQRGPSDAEVQAGLDEMKQEMTSTQFIDAIDFEDIPPPEAVDQVYAPMVEAAQREDPAFIATVGDMICKLYLSADESPNDPYFATEITPSHVIVIINRRHPHWQELDGAAGVLNFLRHCVYDALAEWKAERLRSPLTPQTMRLIKDRLLRLPSEIEQAEAMDESTEADQEVDDSEDE